MQNKIRFSGLAFLAAAIFALSHQTANASGVDANGSLQPTKAISISSKHNERILYFQHADKGYISQEKNSPSCYKVNLNQLKKHVIYFADQPVRLTGAVTWPAFQLTWQHNVSIGEFRPNAIIHAIDVKKNKPVNDTVILSNFKYDKTKNVASYTACAINPKATFASGQLSDVSLFLDPFHPWP